MLDRNSKVKSQKLKVISWTPKAGYDLNYLIKKGSQKFFFNLQKNFSQPLKVTINLKEPNTTVEVRGIFIGKSKMSFPWELVIHHQAVNTKANVLIKGVLDNRSQTSFKGLIKIDPQAQGIESFLAHHTLILNPEAKVKTSPSLEIEANQVKASHASTIHYLSDEQIFYLTSRGINPDQAKKIIIKGFIEEAKFKLK